MAKTRELFCEENMGLIECGESVLPVNGKEVNFLKMEIYNSF